MKSLPRLVKAVRNTLGDDALRDGVIVRDATGRLGFVAAREVISDDVRVRVGTALAEALGCYARPHDVLAFRDDPGANRLLNDPARLPMHVDDVCCQLVDRRIVGSGWLDTPGGEVAGPPRIVFSSVKGGVGRSTALAVAAADLARRNRNVLVVDLDLEAPGIGELLLNDDRKPRFGVADFLVEDGIGGVPDSRLGDFVGVSGLTLGTGGRVDVVPAFGREAVEHPENVLAKLSRAMIEDIGAQGEVITTAEQITTLIRRLTERDTYNVVLIDSRAGFGELSAPAILALGATTLLFGTAQKQTLEAYRPLLAALQLLARRDVRTKGKADWRLNLKTVHAKASLSESALARHRDGLYDLFAEFLYDAETAPLSQEDAVSFGIDDRDAPHAPLVIFFNQQFIDFDPIYDRGQLTQSFYEQTFRQFLDSLDEIIAASGDPGTTLDGAT